MDSGLDQAEKLQPGKGWVAADVQADSDKPLALAIDAGVKLTPDWAAYGDAWVQPTEGRFGGDVGARYKDNLTIFAGASASTRGDVEAEVGVKWEF